MQHVECTAPAVCGDQAGPCPACSVSEIMRYPPDEYTPEQRMTTYLEGAIRAFQDHPASTEFLQGYEQALCHIQSFWDYIRDKDHEGTVMETDV